MRSAFCLALVLAGQGRGQDGLYQAPSPRVGSPSDNAPWAALGGVEPVVQAPTPSQPFVTVPQASLPAQPGPAGPLGQPFVSQQAFQRRIGRIFIEGNTRTKDRVVRQYLELAPGDVANTTKLRTSQRNLIATRLFEVDLDQGIVPTVEFAPGNDPAAEFQDLVVTVQETETAAFGIGAGVNSDLGVAASAVVHERNFDIGGFTRLSEGLGAFRGAGQEFRLEAVPGSHVHRYSIAVSEPRLFGTQYAVGASGYYFRRRYQPYHEQRGGGYFTVGRPFGESWYGSFKVRLENVQISNPDVPTAPDIADVLGASFVTGLRVAVGHDTRDSQLRPSRGHDVEMGIEQVLGTFDFPQLTARAQQFWTLTEGVDGDSRQILSLSGQLGYSGSQTPVFERFFAGGFSSIRGFQFRGVGPRVLGSEVGGRFLLLASAEYQIPIYTEDVVGVLFVDSGTVETDVEINDYRVAAGFGFRVTTALTGPTPLAFDFAFPISDAPNDDRQLFSFFVGFFR